MTEKIQIIKTIRNSLLGIAFAFTVFSCGKQDFFEGNEPVSASSWKHSDVKAFTVNIDDTVSSYDFFIDLRHNESYPYNNIYFFMTVTLPNNQRIVDTIGYYMQDAGQHWLGNHSGSLITHHVLVKQNRRFPRKGRYVFSLRNGMRDNPLNGITDVGITLKKRNAEN
jgi:gliding motility-associated lipoprotein GldH